MWKAMHWSAMKKPILCTYMMSLGMCVAQFVKNMESPKGIVLHKGNLYVLSMQQPVTMGSLRFDSSGHLYATTYCLLKYSI